MADPDRSWADAASADDVVESPSRHRGEVVPPVSAEAAGAGDDIRISARRTRQADDGPTGPGETTGMPAAAEQAGDDWVPL